MPDPSTCDLYDEHGEALAVCDTPLPSYGGRTRFAGPISTVRCHEDNVLIERALNEPGEGRVLVVDGSGSLHRAVLGDRMAGLAQSNGWAGVVVHGAVRDSAELGRLDVGIRALGTNPRKSLKHGEGARDEVVGFGGAVFTPGARVVCDEDGVVVLPVGLA